MAGDTSKKKLVGRHKRVAFMDVAGDGKTYTRMTGFTSLSDGKNSTEYILIRAVPIVDYSDEIELSKDSGLNYTMEDKRNGVNHLIVTGKGELKDRNVLHLYVWPNGSFKKTQYYKGLAEITQVYENTSTETDELESQSTKKLQELCSKKIFGMDIAKLGIDVGIGDIVGGRDYLTGMYSSRPVANIIYSVTNRVESKEYELEGESDNGNS